MEEFEDAKISKERLVEMKSLEKDYDDLQEQHYKLEDRYAASEGAVSLLKQDVERL